MGACRRWQLRRASQGTARSTERNASTFTVRMGYRLTKRQFNEPANFGQQSRAARSHREKEQK